MQYRKLAFKFPKSAKCKHSAHYSTPVNGKCSFFPLAALFTQLSKCMVYTLLRVPVRSGVPAVLSSCRPCFMLPARLLACPVRAPHGFLFWFSVQFHGSRCGVRLPLDTQEHITFPAVCQAESSFASIRFRIKTPSFT